MHNDGSSCKPNGGEESTPVRCNREAFLCGRPELKLLRLAIRESLAQQVETTADVRTEKHPLAISRPAGVGAMCGRWAHHGALETAVKRHQTTGFIPHGSHLRRNQNPLVIGRQVGAMCHALL